MDTKDLDKGDARQVTDKPGEEPKKSWVEQLKEDPRRVNKILHGNDPYALMNLLMGSGSWL